MTLRTTAKAESGSAVCALILMEMTTVPQMASRPAPSTCRYNSMSPVLLLLKGWLGRLLGQCVPGGAQILAVCAEKHPA